MDQTSKEQFKWKFWLLTIILNAIILLVAIAVIGLFKVPPPFTLPFFAGCVVTACLLAWKFRGLYHKTKQWLEDHSDAEK